MFSAQKESVSLKCISGKFANSLPPTQVVMPLHLEKVRDKLAENIHELWGMNKIELGWSFGKVRSTCIRVVELKKVLTLASMNIFSRFAARRTSQQSDFFFFVCLFNLEDV